MYHFSGQDNICPSLCVWSKVNSSADERESLGRSHEQIIVEFLHGITKQRSPSNFSAPCDLWMEQRWCNIFPFFSQAVMPVCVMHWLHLLALHRYKSLWWDVHSPVTSSCNLIQRVDLWLMPLHLLTYICLGTVEVKKAVFHNKKEHILSFPMKSSNILWETWQGSSENSPVLSFQSSYHKQK